MSGNTRSPAAAPPDQAATRPRRTATPTRHERKAQQRDAAVAAALELAEREGAGALTMRRLGEEIAVDPTVLYRLFGDKDELLLAVYEQIMTISLETIAPDNAADDDWQEVLRRTADAMWDVTARFPAIVGLMGARTTGGPSERQLVELILSTFVRAGLPPTEAVLHYRAFVDAMLAMCGQTAAILVLEPQIRVKDASAWSRIYASLPEQEYPAARQHIAELTAVTDRQIYDTVIEAVIAAARARIPARP
jgi:AcrR family transcriptional regulator